MVFFDDILVYTKTLDEHLLHLTKVFDNLKEHSFFAKRSKCSFGQPKIEYLGYIITADGVVNDPTKIQAMIAWARPTTIKALKGFLHLTGYYRKHVLKYGSICRPLTKLLKKESFRWNEEADLTFETLKRAITNTLVLALQDYSKEFIVETDAS